MCAHVVTPANTVAPAGLVDRIDSLRAASRLSTSEHRAEMGQYLTPPPVARFMASLFSDATGEVRLLDAGAGVGTLTAAFVEHAAGQTSRPSVIAASLYELDPALYSYLGATIEACGEACRASSIRFEGAAYNRDFVEEGVAQLRRDLFGAEMTTYNRAILNPPYKKIHSRSPHRLLLREIGVETSNLYTGFLALVVQLLEPNGELVAITPRSFCNGPYFKPFRRLLLADTAIRRLHVFETRDQAFGEDDVLQENVIFHVVKGGAREKVMVSRAHGVDDDTLSLQELAYEEVVQPGDPDLIIHIPANGVDRLVRQRISLFEHTLDELGLAVSTGRVVEFRARAFLRTDPEPGAAPLIYPHHMRTGSVQWPRGDGRKPEAIAITPETEDLLVPGGCYVLVKRFSSKEERRRIVAAVYDPDTIAAPRVAFENHVNYFHAEGTGLAPGVAAGLSCYLNSTLVDAYFRQFSGHTQVNASDLRMLRYPTLAMLTRLGLRAGLGALDQRQIDRLIEEELLQVTEGDTANPIAAKQKVEEALAILRAVGMPRAQLNERSALTLLALLDLKPASPWANAHSRMIGITPLMDFCRQHYGTSYAPNTRETFRRQTMHQFVEAGLVIANPDDPERAVNSPKWCYQVAPVALKLVRSFGSEKWEDSLAAWRSSAEPLSKRYARERAMYRVPVQIAEGVEQYLTPGKHSELIRAIVEEFGSRFAPGGKVVYIGDTGDKWAYFDKEELAALGVTVDEHGKMPDVVIYDARHEWLLLIEAVTSHGPVNPQRHAELARLFADARPGLVFVTAFLTRSDMARYAADISWETEVWVAEAESHLIHFNGERFLGPHT